MLALIKKINKSSKCNELKDNRLEFELILYYRINRGRVLDISEEVPGAGWSLLMSAMRQDDMTSWTRTGRKRSSFHHYKQIL
jgi:hypothetical protein